MKRIIAALLIVFLLLTGCGKTSAVSSSVPSSQAVSVASSKSTSSSAVSTVSQPVSYDTKPDDMSAVAFLRQNFPVTDGSTSTIPLDAAVRSAIFNTGLDYETGNVKHTTTFGSFERLLSGEADLTYTVPLSAEQKQAAADVGIELEMVPIAREAFVFVLNAKNPVTSLTQEQLRGIYSGEITNWKQVGGNDAEIVAYQRNLTSGSQTYMTAFMGDTPLMQAPQTIVAATMGELMDAVALYDNAENAIGYSVYAYAADMYGTGTELKFAAVDGIAPDDTTMTDGTYPLLSENYAIFRASEPEGSPARVLAEWLVTEDGQTAVSNGGYIPFGVDPSTVVAHDNAWAEVGTGPKATGKETLPTSYYKADLNETSYNGTWNDGAYTVTLLDESELKISNRDRYTSESVVWDIRADFTGLTDDKKNAQITKFLNDSIAQLKTESLEVEAYVRRLNLDAQKKRNIYYEVYSISCQWHRNEDVQWKSAVQIDIQCYNGYLSAAVFLSYYGSEESGIYDCRTAIFDLYTGKQVPYTDLFYSGTNIADGLNSAVKQYVNDNLNWDMGYAHIRHENPIVTDEVTNFTLNKIYYPRINHCFNAGVIIEYDIFAKNSQVSRLRSMDGFWSSAVKVYRTALTETIGYGQRRNGVLADKEKWFYAVEADDYVSRAAADKINASVLAYIDEVHSKPLMDYYKETGMTRNELVLYFNSGIDDNLKSTLDDYLNDRGGTIEKILGNGIAYNQNAPTVICGKCVVYPRAGAYFWSGFLDSDYPLAFYLPVCLIFDIDTGEPIQLSKLFLNGWEKAAIWSEISATYYSNSEPTEIPNVNNLALVNLQWGRGYAIQSVAIFMTKDGKNTYRAEIPGEYLNFD